jgi:hypothetical protein|tara:strand:- start:268 stop:894 length:627 start_codon:yes stop_codon:yes gene_type:complete
MMKNKLKTLGAVLAIAGLSACSSMNSTYSIKSEKGDVVNKVPKWYMADFSETKACDLSMFNKEDNDKQCIFGVGTAVSPDLNLAIEKGKMIAKAELADIIKGEMNKSSKQFITELGKTEKKTIVSEVESTIINLIKDTPVRGYEIFAQDVTLTKEGYYRAWVGLRLPLGEFNKMYNYNVEQAVDAFNLNEASKKAYENLMKDNDNNGI